MTRAALVRRVRVVIARALRAIARGLRRIAHRLSPEPARVITCTTAIIDETHVHTRRPPTTPAPGHYSSQRPPRRERYS